MGFGLGSDVNPKHNRGLLLIAGFKLCKGCLLLTLALGILHLLHKDVQQALEDWINVLRIDPDNRYVAGLLAKAGLVDDRKLEELSALTFLYATLFLTEGVGLFLEKPWAEWLCVVATSSLIPVEIYEVFKHLTTMKALLLIGNVAIVWFLVRILRRNHKQSS